MATMSVMVLTCDLCETEDLVSTHNMYVDGTPVEFEACDGCWNKVLEQIAVLARVGRKPVKLQRVSKKASVVDFPGETWRFTAHALERLGTRHITPRQACLAADDPQLTRGAKDPVCQIRERDKIKVVINEAKRLILTVSNTAEEDEAVA